MHGCRIIEPYSDEEGVVVQCNQGAALLHAGLAKRVVIVDTMVRFRSKITKGTMDKVMVDVH